MIIDLNDNAPEFLLNDTRFIQVRPKTASSFPIESMRTPMNLPARTELIQLKAIDRDQPGPNSMVRYSIRTSEELEDMFRIDERTGVLTLNKGKK